MMTRKNCVHFAEMVSDLRDADFDERTLEEVAQQLSIILKQDNSRFDRGRFLTACRRTGA